MNSKNIAKIKTGNYFEPIGVQEIFKFKGSNSNHNHCKGSNSYPK